MFYITRLNGKELKPRIREYENLGYRVYDLTGLYKLKGFHELKDRLLNRVFDVRVYSDRTIWIH